MADPIRAALDRLLSAERFIGEAAPEYQQARDAARAALAGARPATNDPIRAALERLLTDIDDLVSESVGVAGLHKNFDLAPWSELLEGGEYQEWLGEAITQARVALADACRANPAGQLLTNDELRRAWNAQADRFNGWDHLGLDEQLEWAQRQALQRLASGSPSANVDDVENLAARLMSDAERAGAAEEAWNLAREAEELSDTLDQGSPEERFLERIATVLRHVVRAIQNPPATEEELNEAREEVTEWSPDKIADRISKLAQVQAKAGRELSAALCERASGLISELIAPAPAIAPPHPVPINERPPGPTDLNDDGDCWFDMGADIGWMLCDLVYALKYGSTLWLPFSAMPIPATTPAGQEGGT